MHKAFTLIELLIVIAITAILAIVGVMNLISHKQERDLDFTVQEIITVLRNSQNRSISQEEGSRWGIHFDNPAGVGNDFYELFKGQSYADGAVYAKINIRSNVQFNIPASGSSLTVVFAPITGLPNASASVKISLISNPAISSEIIVNKNGEIQY